MIGSLRVWVLCVVSVLSVHPGHAEIPDVFWMSEMIPPTAEEWVRAYIREAARHEADCWQCQKVTRVQEPLRIDTQVEYLSTEPSCGCASGRSALRSGEYGIFHPGPYYIPNPTLSVEWPAAAPSCPSHLTRKTSRDPDNRIEMTIGVWE